VTSREIQELLDRALEALLDFDSRWRVIASTGCLIVTRRWRDESMDTLIVLGSEAAYGTRENRQSGQTWCVQGRMVDVIRAARELREPVGLDLRITVE
jgi:hypothetical protein